MIKLLLINPPLTRLSESLPSWQNRTTPKQILALITSHMIWCVFKLTGIREVDSPSQCIGGEGFVPG